MNQMRGQTTDFCTCGTEHWSPLITNGEIFVLKQLFVLRNKQHFSDKENETHDQLQAG